MTAKPRLDLYRGIHKALRKAFADTLVGVGALDVEDEAALGAGLDAVEALLTLCRRHLDHENAFIHAALLRRRPTMALATAEDHDHHILQIDRLAAQVQRLRVTGPAGRPPLADRLYDELADFVQDNLAHMRVEERDNNAALWTLYSDAELADLHRDLVASIPPQEMVDVLRLMLPAFSPGERRALLADLQATLPPPVFEALVGSLAGCLAPEPWQRLLASLADPAAARAA